MRWIKNASDWGIDPLFVVPNISPSEGNMRNGDLRKWYTLWIFVFEMLGETIDDPTGEVAHLNCCVLTWIGWDALHLTIQ